MFQQATICGLKCVFLHKSGQQADSMTWATNTIQMVQNMPKPVHCFMFVMVASHVNEILIRNGGAEALSNALTTYLADLGTVWPIAQHYREKRVEYYGSAAALFHVAGNDASASTAVPLGFPRISDTLATAAQIVQLAGSAGDSAFPEDDEEVMDPVSFAMDAARSQVPNSLFAQVSSSVNLGRGVAPSPAPSKTPSDGSPSPRSANCGVCGNMDKSCGCEQIRAHAPYHSARLESKKRAPPVPEVLKPPAFAKMRKTAPAAHYGVAEGASHPVTSASAAAAAAGKSTERMKRGARASIGSDSRMHSSGSSSLDVDADGDDLLDDLLFTFMPEAVGNLGLFASFDQAPVPAPSSGPASGQRQPPRSPLGHPGVPAMPPPHRAQPGSAPMITHYPGQLPMHPAPPKQAPTPPRPFSPMDHRSGSSSGSNSSGLSSVPFMPVSPSQQWMMQPQSGMPMQFMPMPMGAPSPQFAGGYQLAPGNVTYIPVHMAMAAAQMPQQAPQQQVPQQLPQQVPQQQQPPRQQASPLVTAVPPPAPSLARVPGGPPPYVPAPTATVVQPLPQVVHAVPVESAAPSNSAEAKAVTEPSVPVDAAAPAPATSIPGPSADLPGDFTAETSASLPAPEPWTASL